MDKKFKVGDTVAYSIKDSFGVQHVMGIVTGYGRIGGKSSNWVTLKTLDGVSLSIPEQHAVFIPTVWGDSLKPVVEKVKRKKTILTVSLEVEMNEGDENGMRLDMDDNRVIFFDKNNNKLENVGISDIIIIRGET